MADLLITEPTGHGSERTDLGEAEIVSPDLGSTAGQARPERREGSGSPYDIRALLRHVGGVGVSGAVPSLEEREVPANPAELLDHAPLNLGGVEPAPVSGFVDGIQASMRLTYREHRAVILQHVAAGCLAPDGGLAEERYLLSVVCAPQEREWVEASGAGIPIEEVEAEWPAEIERAAGEMLAPKRERLEREVVILALDRTKRAGDDGILLIDGHIVGRARDERCAGVVKSTNTRYLEDERVLMALREGWRSPRFVLRGQGVERYSAYLRLFDASYHGWDFGLVRIETFDPDLIDSVGAAVLANRQGRGADGRWDRHIAGMANVERQLRARRSPVFDGW